MIERQCMKCRYAVRDPAATPDQIIAGQVPFLCHRNPPSASVMMVQQGRQTGMVTVTAYPQVNATSVSCGEFRPHPTAEREVSNGPAA